MTNSLDRVIYHSRVRGTGQSCVAEHWDRTNVIHRRRNPRIEYTLVSKGFERL